VRDKNGDLLADSHILNRKLAHQFREAGRRAEEECEGKIMLNLCDSTICNALVEHTAGINLRNTCIHNFEHYLTLL
jgi:hypothetical protein